MLYVKRTKKPSLIQMSRMAKNLRDKYRKYVSIDACEDSHYGSGNHYSYFKLYIELLLNHNNLTWDQLQNLYFYHMQY